MTIQQIGFVDTSMFTAMYLMKYRERLEDGVLPLRSIKDGEAEPSDLPILKEWKSARALLSRIRTGAAAYFNGVTPELGGAHLEVLPPHSGTPWAADDGADDMVRTRTCLIPSPGAVSHCGSVSANLLVGILTVVDHRQLCSEVNHGDFLRVHLIVDVRVPPDAGG